MMAYQIRYGPEGWKHQKTTGRRSAVPLILIALAVLLALEWETVRELAAAAAGEGWYHALAVWCRTIIDAGMA